MFTVTSIETWQWVRVLTDVLKSYSIESVYCIIPLRFKIIYSKTYKRNLNDTGVVFFLGYLFIHFNTVFFPAKANNTVGCAKRNWNYAEGQGARWFNIILILSVLLHSTHSIQSFAFSSLFHILVCVQNFLYRLQYFPANVYSKFIHFKVLKTLKKTFVEKTFS